MLPRIMKLFSPGIYFQQRARSLWFGLTLPYRAGCLILSSGTLLFWSVLPVILTFVLYVYGISTLQGYAIGFLRAHIVEWVGSPDGIIGMSVMFLGRMSLWVVAAFTFAVVSSMVASPFNDRLAERTEGYTLPPLPPAVCKSIRQQIKLVGIDIFKTMSVAFAGLFALLVLLVPVLNIIAFVIVSLLVTFQYISYPQTRRGIGLARGARFLWDHIFACAGFGAALTVLFAVPFFSSIVLPVAVTGGTILVARAQGLR